jgi:hypothetical protein
MDNVAIVLYKDPWHAVFIRGTKTWDLFYFQENQRWSGGLIHGPEVGLFRGFYMEVFTDLVLPL